MNSNSAYRGISLLLWAKHAVPFPCKSAPFEPMPKCLICVGIALVYKTEETLFQHLPTPHDKTCMLF